MGIQSADLHRLLKLADECFHSGFAVNCPEKPARLEEALFIRTQDLQLDLRKVFIMAPVGERVVMVDFDGGNLAEEGKQQTTMLKSLLTFRMLFVKSVLILK